MDKVNLRIQKITDAKKFFKILNNPNFVYFNSKPKTIQEEIEFIKKNTDKRKKNFEHNYTILYDNEIVGACGIKINQHRKYIGEIGYFLDENYWNKGIATKTVKLLEDIGFYKLGLKRFEILMMLKNIASQKVAIKSGYKKEGIMRKVLQNNKKFEDCYLYAKIL